MTGTASSSLRLPVLAGGLRPLPEAERLRIADDLGRLDVGEVRFDAHNRLLYSTDASLYQVEPIGVVIPKDIDAVAPLLN